MTDLDLARIKSDAIDATYRAEPLADDVLALLDRIEALELQRLGYRAISRNHNADAVAQRARADLAEARLARVKALHTESRESISALHPEPVCRGCHQHWPCATIRAVAADEKEKTND
jgi:hypothetical protein